MTAAWAGVAVGGGGLIAALVTLIWHGGRLSAVLDQLVAIAADHERRLRVVERWPAEGIETELDAETRARRAAMSRTGRHRPRPLL